MFNKLRGGKNVCPNRAFYFRTVREKGNYFWKGDRMRVSGWEGDSGDNKWVDLGSFNKTSPNIFKTERGLTKYMIIKSQLKI